MPGIILLLIPNFGFGGAQRVFSEHASLFAEDHQVEECVFNLDQPHEYDKGHPVHSLEVNESTHFFSKLLNFIRRVQRLKKIKREQQYDFCISHLEGADYVNVLSRQSEKIILVVHGSKVADENMGGLTGYIRKKLLIPWLYRKADLIVTVSDGIREELEKVYGLPARRIVSIPNYFDIEKIVRESRLKESTELDVLKKEHRIILYSGRFALQKNLPPLFHIFKLLQQTETNVKLVLVGDGELKTALLEECRALQLNSYTEEQPFHERYDVYFLGYQKNPFPYILESDLFVMTSKWEGFPLALCEAMALGACVVAADCPTGPRQILLPDRQEAAGVLLPIPTVKEESLKSWKNAWVDLLKDDQARQRYGQRARERARDFSKEAVALKWKAILN